MPNIKEDSILDYVNGHLSGAQLDDFEKALKQNPSLLEKVNETKAWQATLQSSRQGSQHSSALNDGPVPQFSSIESKLHKRTWRWSYALPTAASVALVAVLVVNFDGNNDMGISTQANNEFETLTDATSTHTTPVLQIVLADNANADDFVQEYGLSIVKSYAQTQIIDVELSEGIQDDLQALESDPRVIFIKRTETNDE